MLQVSKEDLEHHICAQYSAQYSDPTRKESLGTPSYVPKAPEPSVLFDASAPKLCEV